MTTRGVITSCVACLAILGTVLVGIGPASASPRFTVTVNHTHLVSRQVLTVTATSTVPCTWGVRWAGQVRIARNVKVVVARFVAPRVTRARKYPLFVICNYGAPGGSRTYIPGHRWPNRNGADVQFVSAVVPAHWFRAMSLIVDPPGGPASGPVSKPGTKLAVPPALLPDTGGPLGSLLVVAFGLLLTGAGALRLARRRAAPA